MIDLYTTGSVVQGGTMRMKQQADWVEVVKKTVDGISFGVVTIVVHNSKVVQVDRTEKLRFESDEAVRICPREVRP